MEQEEVARKYCKLDENEMYTLVFIIDYFAKRKGNRNFPTSFSQPNRDKRKYKKKMSYIL